MRLCVSGNSPMACVLCRRDHPVGRHVVGLRPHNKAHSPLRTNLSPNVWLYGPVRQPSARPSRTAQSPEMHPKVSARRNGEARVPRTTRSHTDSDCQPSSSATGSCDRVRENSGTARIQAHRAPTVSVCLHQRDESPISATKRHRNGDFVKLGQHLLPRLTPFLADAVSSVWLCTSFTMPQSVPGSGGGVQCWFGRSPIKLAKLPNLGRRFHCRFRTCLRFALTLCTPLLEIEYYTCSQVAKRSGSRKNEWLGDEC